MNEYKRITERCESYIETNCENCKYSEGCTRYEEDCFEVILSILAELEDKIESGYMKEFPCKVGDTVYFADDFNSEVAELTVFETCINKRGVIIRCKMTDNSDYNIYHLKPKEICLTKAEAEARLKELEEGRNDR